MAEERKSLASDCNLVIESSVRNDTAAWYHRYTSEKGSLRNDLLENPGVLFQDLAFTVSCISALRATRINRASSRILDVGCGEGGSLIRFLRLEFEPSLLYGIEILNERIEEGRRKLPNINWACGDAASMQYDDNTFDIVYESTMFVQIIDEFLAERIANEMLRVVKPGGYVVLSDWRYSMPNDTRYKALSKRRISSLFHVGSQSIICATYKGALIPPLGRFLSTHAPSLYFPICRIFPFLVGQTTTVLQKQR